MTLGTPRLVTYSLLPGLFNKNIIFKLGARGRGATQGPQPGGTARLLLLLLLDIGYLNI